MPKLRTMIILQELCIPFLFTISFLFTLFSLGAQEILLDESLDRTELYQWISQHRRSKEVSVLLTDHHLESVACDYVKKIFQKNTLSHWLDGSVLERVQRKTNDYVQVGEILGAGPSLQSIAQAWLESNSHHEALDLQEWTHIGACRQREDGIEVYAVLFGEKP